MKHRPPVPVRGIELGPSTTPVASGRVIPRFKKAEPKLPYLCPKSHFTRTTIHCGKTDAMFDYLDRVKISYIMTQGSQKDYRAANNGSLRVAQLPQA
jgi:hypothetical protein